MVRRVDLEHASATPAFRGERGSRKRPFADLKRLSSTESVGPFPLSEHVPVYPDRPGRAQRPSAAREYPGANGNDQVNALLRSDRVSPLDPTQPEGVPQAG